MAKVPCKHKRVVVVPGVEGLVVEAAWATQCLELAWELMKGREGVEAWEEGGYLWVQGQEAWGLGWA